MSTNFFKGISKKLLIIGLVSVLFVTAVVPLTSHATTTEEACRATAGDIQELYDGCMADAAKAAAALGAQPNTTSQDAGGFFGSPIKFIVVTIGNILTTLLSLFLGIAGMALDFIVKYTVTDLAKNLKDITGINIAWRLIRDLCNMSFIFILLYEGIMMIFGKGDAKKIVPNIIIAAILINFSIFFTKVIIDASNVVAISFYNSIIQSNTTATGVGNISAAAGTISGAFMKNLNITSFFGSGAFAATGGDYFPMFTNIVGSSILIIVATFSFLAIAALFLLRYLTFIILLIMSPVGYVSSAIPGLKTYGDMYWKNLTSQALFAPIYMIMTWVTLTIAGSSGFLTEGGTGNLGTVFNGKLPQQDSIALLIKYALIIGLMITSIKMAKESATKGAMITTDLAGKATAFAGGTLFGGAAALGRGTLGAKANTLASSEDLKDRAAKGSRFAQLQLKAYKGIAGASFDARKTGAVGALQKQSGLDFGKGLAGIPFTGKDAAKIGEGGYKKAVEDQAKAEKKYAESLKVSGATSTEAKTKLKEAEKELEPTRKAVTDAEKIKKEAEELKKKIEQKKNQLEKRLKNTVLPELKAQLENEVRQEEANITRAENDTEAAETSLLDAKKARDAFDKEWASRPDIENLIKLSGGDKDRKIESTNNDRINNYAESFEKKNYLTEKWGVGWAVFQNNPQRNKAIAAEIRNATKAKDKDKAIKDLKEILDKEAEAEKPADKAGETTAPASDKETTPKT